MLRIRVFVFEPYQIEFNCEILTPIVPKDLFTLVLVQKSQRTIDLDFQIVGVLADNITDGDFS